MCILTPNAPLSVPLPVPSTHPSHPSIYPSHPPLSHQAPGSHGLAMLQALVMVGALLYVFSKSAKFSMFKPAGALWRTDSCCLNMLTALTHRHPALSPLPPCIPQFDVRRLLTSI